MVEWFSSSIEGQQALSDMIDRDAYLMEGDPHTGRSFTPLQSDLLFSNIERKIRLRQIRKQTLRVAAVLLPLLLITGFGLYINSRTSLFEGTTYTELYVPKGEDARIFFQDGTEVFLNADTRIRYRKPHFDVVIFQPLQPEFQYHRPAFRRKLQSVPDQVNNHFLNRVAIKEEWPDHLMI